MSSQRKIKNEVQYNQSVDVSLYIYASSAGLTILSLYFLYLKVVRSISDANLEGAVLYWPLGILLFIVLVLSILASITEKPKAPKKIMMRRTGAGLIAMAIALLASIL